MKNGIIKEGNLHYDCFKSGFDGNVQGIDGICQCIVASNGGGKTCLSSISKTLRIGGCYWNQQEQYVRRPLWGVSRTLKADGGHPAGIIIEYE